MKVVIVGGGIGGLATYLALKKYLSDAGAPLVVKVYESHSSPRATSSVIGAGLGITPNGQRALHSIAPAAHARLDQDSLHEPALAFRNSTGTLLGKYISGNVARHGYDIIWSSRVGVHEAVLAEVPKEDVAWSKKVVAVRETEDGVEVEFLDSTVEYADLVIGADGVRSAVRNSILGEKYKAVYDGLIGIGGFLPPSSLPLELQKGLQKDPITMTFGPDGMFGLFTCNTGEKQQILWWSTHQSDPPLSRSDKISTIRKRLLEKHGAWKSPYDGSSPIFESLINLTCGSEDDADAETAIAADRNVLVFPRFIPPKLPAMTSPSGRVILMGDAAHGIPPDSGQGVSMVFEDALTIALLLEHYVKTAGEQKDALKAAAEAYEGVRLPRVARFLQNAQRSRGTRMKKTWWQEKVRDWMLWLFCLLPQSWNDRTLQYKVEADVADYLKIHP